MNRGWHRWLLWLPFFLLLLGWWCRPHICAEGERAGSIIRAVQLEEIGVAWRMQACGKPGKQEFPAHDVRSLMEAHGHRAWPYPKSFRIWRRVDNVQDSLAELAIPVMLAFVGVVTYSLQIRRLKWWNGLLLVAFAASSLLCLNREWVWLFAPRKGFDYVEDFTYIEGVFIVSPRRVVAHDRLDLVPGSDCAVVLFSDGSTSVMSKQELQERIRLETNDLE